MSIISPENKPLSIKHRKFIDLIVQQGLDKAEAYCLAFDKEATPANAESIRVSSTSLFYKSHIQNYYNAVMEEVRDKQVAKSMWTKDVATQKLMRLIEKAEQDIYGDPTTGEEPKQLTMGRLNAIVLPAKELNLMHGLNQTNVNLGGCVVQINGEAEIPD